MTIRAGDNMHIMTRQRSAMQRLASTVPLPLILLAQAAISIIALRNTAFLDEALYIYAGEQLLQGKATIGQYATYFSGYPDFYPAIAGLLNLLGGLELVRLCSTVCMLFVTSCVFLVTERLYDRSSAYAAAALFAFTGPTLFLSHLATFDALALMFLAMATTLAASVASARDNQLAMRISLFIAVLLVLAVAAKYATLLWVPFVLAILAVQTIGQQGWRRGWYYPIVTIAGIAAIRWLAIPLITNDVSRGITSTTTNRTAMIPEPLAMLLATILQAGSLIWVLGLLGLLLMPRWQRLVSWLLVIASLAAPVYHLYSGESTSLYKHMSFALFFAAPVAGTAVGIVMERVSSWWSTYRLLQLAGALGCAAVLVAVLAHIVTLSIGNAQRQYASWPSTSQLATTMAPLLSGKHMRCLCEDAEVLEYELSATTTAAQYTGPYYFEYHVGKQALVGGAAYTAAIDAGYFDVIELNFYGPVTNVAVAAIQSGHAQYRRVAKIPQNNAANIYYMVWTKVVQSSASPLHISGNHLANSCGQTVVLSGVVRNQSDSNFSSDRTSLDALGPPVEQRRRADGIWPRCKAAQRVSCASSRSLMVAKYRSTSAVLVSGHRCSAGCNSGEKAAEEQMDLRGHLEPQTGVPHRTEMTGVEDQNQLLSVI